MHIRKTILLQHYTDNSLFTETELQLIQQAQAATHNAYAPYSQFYVGAALLLSDHSLVSGSNQENASFPNGLCAERVALNTFGNMHNGRHIVALAVAARSLHYKIPRPLCPCGGCLQVMADFVKRQQAEFKVILISEEGDYYVAPGVSTFLPFGFELEP
jgi:cytidine deaminase